MPVREVGQVAFPLPEGSQKSGYIIDRETRRGFRIADHGEGITSVTISSFDLDSLDTIETATFDEFTGNAKTVVTAVGDGLLFVADVNGWVHAFTQAPLQRFARFPGPLPVTGGELNWSTVYELRHGALRLTRHGARQPVTPYPLGRLQGMTYVPAGPRASGGKLLLLTHYYGQDVETPATLALHQWDARTGEELRVERLRGCATGRGNNTTVPRWTSGLDVRAVPGGRQILIGCIGRGQAGEIWTVGYDDDDRIGSDQVRVAQVFGAGDVLFDVAGGRAHSITSELSGQSVVTVDLDRKGIVGAVGLAVDDSTPVGAGVDRVSGRVYVVAPPTAVQGGRTNAGGLLLVDGRRTPLPQGTSIVDEGAPSRDIVRVDARPDGTRRLFVRRLTPAGLPEPFIRVYEDAVPATEDAPPDIADRFTVDVPEKPGLTTASYAAAATGYGTRAILIGGLSALPDPVAYVIGMSATKDISRHWGARADCDEALREVTFAAVQRGTSLTDTSVSASAAAAEADPRTIQDLSQPVESCGVTLAPATAPTRAGPDDVLGRAAPATGQDRPWRDARVPDGDADPANDDNPDRFVGPDFPFLAALCLPPEQPRDERPRQGDRAYRNVPELESFSSAVDCSKEGRVEATATAAPAGFGDVTFGRSSVASELRKEEKGGVVATTTAEVRSVTIADVLTIARIRSHASAKAAGRPKTAGADYRTEVCGVRLLGLDIPNCFDPRSSQGAAIISQLNVALALREYELRVPAPDAALRAGTPGGASASLQKSRFGVQGDRLFNADASTAVPALELIRTHPSVKGRGRQVYQFAGVEATTTYNIALIPTGAGPGAPPPGDAPGQGTLGSGGGLDGPAMLTVPGGPGPERTVLQRIADAVYAIVRAVQWLLRHPLEALTVIAFLLSAFAFPLHLLERRRALALSHAGRGL